MSKASDKMRVDWKANDAKRDAGLTTPDDIKRFDNLIYGDDLVNNVLDVYRPKNVEEKLPVIISVHGGGWVYGDKELYQFYGMTLAQRQFAVINFTYRLAPESKFPAQLEDTNNVVKWMFDHAEDYGFDTEHVFMVGDSAGAHLAGLYAEICTNEDYAKKYEFTVPNHFVPNALALNCGEYNPATKEKLNDGSDTKYLMSDLLPNHGSEEEAEQINVMNHLTPDFPPVYLMTGIGDFCRENTINMDKALTKHNIKHIFKTYGSEEKPLYHVFHVTIQEEAGQKCNDDECAFFKTFC